MLDSVKWRLHKRDSKKRSQRFNELTTGIFDTPPVELVDGPVPFRIVSMIAPNDVQPYLICLKALYRRVGFGQVTAIVDRATPDEARNTLKEHVRGIELLDLEDIDPGRCQRGGTWERLYHCIDRSQDSYVIQIDADVMVNNEIDEVIDYIKSNTPFTIGGKIDIKPAREYIPIGEETKSNHIVIEQERAFKHYPNLGDTKYVRASSGFCGFAKGGYSLEQIQDFHETMVSILGERWKEWGTEQVGSNFTIANSPGGVRLPFPKYTSHRPDLNMPEKPYDCSGIHFIGSHRYLNDVFLNIALEEIKALNAA